MKKLIFIAITALLFGTATEVDAAKPRRNTSKARQVNYDELFDKAELQYAMYEVAELETTLSDIEEKLEKNENKQAAKRLETYQSRLVNLRNMLGRVENIVIVDSLSAPKEQVLDFYRLSSEAGTLSIDENGCVSHTPESGREVFVTTKSDSTGSTVIEHAGILDDGTRDDATILDLRTPAKSEFSYPFMLSDGSTLYFAAEGESESSLGGLDIFMTRRDESGNFFSPTNVGMPYNSPYNDYMMAIDEATGLGWWATDRNAEDGMVTIYIFKPNDTRVNYEPDRSDIADLAFISSYKATQPEGFDAAQTLEALDNISHSGNSSGSAIRLSLGNGVVYTSLNDFKSAEARNMYGQYEEESQELREAEKELAEARAAYGTGNAALRLQILTLENQVDKLRRNTQRTRNTVIRLETGQR